MKRLFYSQLVCVLFLFSPVNGQEAREDTTLAAVDTLFNDFGLFTSNEVLNLSLRFDVTEYMRKKPKEEYMKAVLTYHINERDSINKELKLRSRGISRNSICNFPPISLNFKKEDLKTDEQRKIEKIKMVTHCNSGNEEYLFREFIVYKLYNVLTEYSFRVRLVKISYINTARKNKVIDSYAFLIEPLNMLTERTNSFEVENMKLSQIFINPEIMDRVSIFSYMIGNTDWSVPGQHNVRIISMYNTDNSGRGGMVPYDFDYSGLVNTHYALPAEPLGLESVRERFYLGACRSDDELRAGIKQFSDNKAEFYRIINEFEYLTEKDKKRMTGYLDEFYSELDKDVLIRTIRRECRGDL
ncbi:MAG TPA: hypothetical protein VMV47_19000 [Bacteroidales bacterium]|nr:hypothetical protein [Bacteroidales bacterium]